MTIHVYAAPLSGAVKQLLDDAKATRELLLGIAEGRDEIVVGLAEQKFRFRPMRGSTRTKLPTSARRADAGVS